MYLFNFAFRFLAFPEIPEMLEIHAHKKIQFSTLLRKYSILVKPQNQNAEKCSILVKPQNSKIAKKNRKNLLP